MLFIRGLKQILMRWGFLLGVVTFVALSIVYFLNLNQVVEVNGWVIRTNVVVSQLTTTMSAIERAETAQRGYLLTGKKVFLDLFLQAQQQIGPETQKSIQLLSVSERQQENAVELEKLVKMRVDRMEYLVSMVQQGLPSEIIKNGLDTTVMDQIRSKVSEIKAWENENLQRRLVSAENRTNRFRLLIVIGVLFSLFMMVINRQLQDEVFEENKNQSYLMNSIISSMGDGLVVVNTEGNVTHSNPAAERIMGMPIRKTQADRNADSKNFDPKTEREIKVENMPLQRSLRGEVIDDFEVLVKTEQKPDGLVFSVNSRPVVSPEGKVVGALALFRDFTRRKEYEKSIDSERQRAIEASKIKSEFLAGMSHEIRTPMNGVIGMTTLLLDTELDQKQNFYAKTIKSSAESLVSLINGILDHSKIEEGKFELQKSDFNLVSLSNDVLDMFRYQAQTKSLILESDIQLENHAWFNGDADRIRQVLVNLLGNAFKFTERGSVSLKISIVDMYEDSYDLRFEVMDSGLGISKGAQKKLFERFSQVHKDKRAYGGSGLGLVLCKEFVHLMGGEIGVESSEGMGSMFWFQIKLPVAKEHISAQKTIKGYAPIKGHILIAEDQPVNQNVVSSYMQKFGLTCEVANNGTEALDLFSKSPGKFDVILMDCQMPVLDGYQATQQIRDFEKKNKLGRIPIVALTAEGRSNDREKCIRSGMDDFLVKPIDLSHFYETMKVHINKIGEVRGAPKPKRSVSSIVFDPAELKKLRSFDSGGRPLDIAMVEEFLDSGVAQADELLRKEPPPTKKRTVELAHALKSTTLAVGFPRLSAMVEQIEDDPDLLMHEYSQLQTVYSQSVAQLRTYLRLRSSQAA